MFKNVQFLFIGKFKGYKHSELKNLISEEQGTTVVNCSGNTNYVVLPNDAGSGEKYSNNQQVQIAQKKGKPIVHLNFILDCIKGRKLTAYDEYVVDEFRNSVKNGVGGGGGGYEEEDPTVGYDPANYTTTSTDPSSLYDLNLYVSGGGKEVWKEYTHTDNRKYYYNIVTGHTQWEKPDQATIINPYNANEEQLLHYQQMLLNFQQQQQQQQQFGQNDVVNQQQQQQQQLQPQQQQQQQQQQPHYEMNQRYDERNLSLQPIGGDENAQMQYDQMGYQIQTKSETEQQLIQQSSNNPNHQLSGKKRTINEMIGDGGSTNPLEPKTKIQKPLEKVI